MLKKRTNVLNKSKDRNKAISKASTAERVKSDIASNGMALYGVSNFYIHNNGKYFLLGAEYANQILRSAFSSIKSAWVTEAQHLKKLCLEKEVRFLSEVGSALNAGGPLSKQEMENKFLNEFNQFYAADFQDIVQKLGSMQQGVKTAGQLRSIAAGIDSINQKLTILQNHPSFDDNFLQNLTAAATTANTFVQTYQHISDDATTDGTGKSFDDTKGLSVRKMILYTLPRTLETLVIKAFNDIAPNYFAKYIGDNTAKGSSADVSYFNTGFSVKMNNSTIKQEKSRIANTFFNWSQNFSQEHSALSEVGNILDSNGAMLTNILKYLFINYASTDDVNAPGILSDAWQIIILSNLNQKLFGYNKTGQKNMNLQDIINQMPVAEVNGRGQIIWFSDVMTSLINRITQDSNNIKSFASYKLNSAFYDAQGLFEAKKSAIQKIAGSSFKKANIDKLNYSAIIALIQSELNSARNALLKSVQLSIQYHINIQDIIQE